MNRDKKKGYTTIWERSAGQILWGTAGTGRMSTTETDQILFTTGPNITRMDTN